MTTEQITLNARIDERRLIIYKLETCLLDLKYENDLINKGYKMCLRDEIKENKSYISEYKKRLKQIK